MLYRRKMLNMPEGMLDLETTVQAAQNLAFKIGPLQYSEKMVSFDPYGAFQQQKTTLAVHQYIFFCQLQGDEQNFSLFYLARAARNIFSTEKMSLSSRVYFLNGFTFNTWILISNEIPTLTVQISVKPDPYSALGKA